MRERAGEVLRKEGSCVGCWTCIMVCPYGVVGREKERRVAVKCDRCPDLAVPACVEACPTRALVFAEAETFGAGVRKAAAGVVVEAMGGGPVT